MMMKDYQMDVENQMRPFRERLIIVLWVLWATASSPIIYIIVNPYWGANDETFSSRWPSYMEKAIALASSTGNSDAARKLSSDYAKQLNSTYVPQSVVDAYAEQRMARTEMEEFETDLRAGLIHLPPKAQVTIVSKHPPFISNLGNLGILVAFPGLCIALLQYLLTGVANPIALFRRQG